MQEAADYPMSRVGGQEYRGRMKRSHFAGLALLGFAMATAAQGQLMRVTFNTTTHIVGDFLALNDRDENGYVIHNPHPVAGSLHFETLIDLAAAGAPGEPQLFASSLWGDIDGLGHLNDFGPTGLAVRRLPDGRWLAEAASSEYSGSLVFYDAILLLNPDLTPAGASIAFRTYDFFPGPYGSDATVWVDASADEMTATRVQGPPLTPVPETVTTGLIAALGLCGFVGWRRWSRGGLLT